MERSDRTSTAFAVTPRRVGWLGLGSIGVILVAMAITAIPYRGYAGEAYSPLNHFVSELGEIAASRLAWVFNLGIVVGGAGMGVFLILATRELTGRYRTALTMAAVVAGVSGSLVGVFPMDYHATHRVVSDAFFLSGSAVAVIFTSWLAAGPRSNFPRLLLAPGCFAISVLAAFVAVYSTYHPADPDARILDRAAVWSVPLLEWASLISLLLLLVSVAVTLVRRPSA